MNLSELRKLENRKPLNADATKGKAEKARKILSSLTSEELVEFLTEARRAYRAFFYSDPAFMQSHVDEVVKVLPITSLVKRHEVACDALQSIFDIPFVSNFAEHEGATTAASSGFPLPIQAQRITMETFRMAGAGALEGDRVRYVPSHANGNIDHPDCENGRISSFSMESVFVRFDKQVEQHGWDNTLSKACDPNDLRIL